MGQGRVVRGYTAPSVAGGFTLIELMLVLTVVAGLTLLSLQREIRDFRQARAAQLGVELYTYNNAVRTWLTVNGTDSSNHGTYNGTDWLKATSCPGGGSFATTVVDAPLSCSFPGATSLGQLSYTTVVSGDPADFSSDQGRACANRGPNAVCAETIMPSLQVGGAPAPDLAGLAALVAAGGAASNLLPVQAATDGVVVLPNDAANRLENAEIVMVAGHSAGNDAWLRTDGSNAMWAPLRWSQFQADGITPLPASSRIMVGVTRVQGFVGEALRLGRGSASPGSLSAGLVTPEVIVDADARIVGDLETLGNVFSRMSVVADQDLRAGRNVTAGFDVAAGRHVTAGADVVAGRYARAQRFYDRDNVGYFADPASTSRMNVSQTRDRRNFPGTDLRLSSDQGSLVSSEGNNMIYSRTGDNLMLSGADALVMSRDDTVIAGRNIMLSGSTSIGSLNPRSRANLSGTVDVAGLYVRTRSGREVPLSMLLPTKVHMGSFTVTDGWFVRKPNCYLYGGEPRIDIDIASQLMYDRGITGNLGAQANRESTQFTAYARHYNFYFWRTHVRSLTLGTPGYATAHTSCVY